MGNRGRFTVFSDVARASNERTERDEREKVNGSSRPHLLHVRSKPHELSVSGTMESLINSPYLR